MTTNYCSLSDDELDREVKRVAGTERQTTAELVRLLIEVERRGLHLALGHSSLFVYCTRALRLSEQAAYSRITAARTAKRHPRLLDLLEDGALTLSSLGLLAPHLSEATVDALLDAARFKTTREVERMLAGAFPQPDVAVEIRAVPIRAVRAELQMPKTESAAAPLLAEPATAVVSGVEGATRDEFPRAVPTVPAPTRPVIAPIAPTRYLLKVTLSQDTEQKLRHARALMRHTIPDGDLDAILNRALTLLLDQVGRARMGLTRKPRGGHATVVKGRHIPAAVRREVWERDGGRCVFQGSDGVCGETSFLEFHHVIPFAAAGPTTADNLQLRCRAHNAYEAARHFGGATSVPTRLGR